jgi:hypothetical protein
MNTLRLRLPAAVLAVIATGLLGGAAAQASQARSTVAAATDTITVSARSNPGESGLVVVDINATSDITSLTAHITDLNSTTDKVTVTGFTLVFGTKSIGTWAAQSPIPVGSGVGELTYGTYDIYIDAADQGGTSVSFVHAGMLKFLIEPVLTLAANPLSVDFDHRDVTFSGQLTGIDPDGNPTTVASGQTVDITGTNDSTTATTDGSGNFQTVHTVTAASYTATLEPGDPTVNSPLAVAGPVTLTVNRDTPHIQAHLAKLNVKYGATDTVTGTLTYQSGSSELPLPGAAVTVTNLSLPSQVAHSTTRTDGRFTITLPKQTRTSVWQITTGNTLFFNRASFNLPLLHVALPTAIRRLSMRLDRFAVLHVKGCVVFTDPADQSRQPSTPIRIEYSAHKTGPWTLLGKMFPSSVSSGYCPGVLTWRHSFRVKLANAYYRARVISTPDLQAAVSAPLHRWKYLTRIRSLTVSSRHVPHGGRLTVSGRLQQHVGTWKPYAHRIVLIVLRPAGQRQWFWIKKVRTRSTGRFSSTFTDPTSATWSAVYQGDKTHFAGGGRLIFVSTSVVMAGEAGHWLKFAGPQAHRLPGGSLP